MNINLLSLLCIIIRQVSSVILLYETDNQDLTQIFDCVYFDGRNESSFTQSIAYCIRLENDTVLERNYSNGCRNDGIRFTFDQLQQLNLSYIELLSWSSSVDAVDRYQTYLNRRTNESDSVENNFICNCTKNGTFGMLCEYELITEKESFQKTLEYQLKLKSNHRLGSQLYGNITCYKTSFQCDYGLRCLDWRQICDGKQQCVDGTDENNCERLMFNECDSETEYRCRNGMCIDQEYFLDGDQGDCLDLSDEQYETPFQFYRCAYTPNIICDERLPRWKEQYGCGDGEVIPEDTILQRDRIRLSCESYRDKNYICELDKYNPRWTNERTGHCHDWGFEDEIMNCNFFLKCALTKGQHRLCNCSGNDCSQIMNSICPEQILFPAGRIFAPFVEAYYLLKSRNFEKNIWPDRYKFIKGIKCDGFQALPNDKSYIEHTNLTKLIREREYAWLPFHSIFCQRSFRIENGSKYNKQCWNESYINRAYHCPKDPFECIPMYNVHDGYSDCLSGDDEKTSWYPNCSSIRKHRFQCSQNESTCLMLWTVGDTKDHCKTSRQDQYSEEFNIDLTHVVCDQQKLDGCQFLRKYIQQSSTTSIDNSLTSYTTGVSLGVAIPFWRYCNSVWDISYGTDEIAESCEDWKCHQDYYQCQTGQCIPLKWLCNNVWDCSDGSDEEGFQRITILSVHNSKLISNLTEMKKNCRRVNSINSFSTQCDITREYPCLLANVNNALDFETNRPCINLTQIGDGHINCYGGLDERNILNCSSYSAQGFSFQCVHSKSSQCILNGYLCNTRCLNKDEDKLLCFHLQNNSQSCQQNKDSRHATLKDVQCLNGTCIPDAKCNGIIECEEFGEDEFYCNTGPQRSTPFLRYRYDAHKTVFVYNVVLASYPDDNMNEITNFIKTNSQQQKSTLKAIPEIKISQESDRQIQARKHSREAWMCNRGVAVRQHNDAILDVCFCPPTYYGRYCQYFSDRLTIITHFEDLTNTLSSTIKILAVFLVNETIIQHHEFHFTAAMNDLKKKHKFYFVHRQPHQLSTSSNYKIRFELYRLNINSAIEFLAVWIYPIQFPFLPSNRLAKILKYRDVIPDPHHLCMTNNPCLNSGTCHPLMNTNDKNSYWCDCGNKSYGNNCQYIDHSCFISDPSNNSLSTLQFCSSSSICRPQYRDQQPLCICSMHYHGNRCFSQRQCNLNEGRNPCLNGGTCYVNYELHNLLQDYVCICPKNYFGERCEIRSATINITYSHNQSDAILGTLIQLFDIDDNIALRLKKQLVYKHQLPTSSVISYEKKLIPMIGLIKTYRGNVEFIMEYHLLYIHTVAEQYLNVTLHLKQLNYCPHSSNVLQMNETISDRPVFKYHTLCTDNKTLRCFHDDYYFCLCDVNNVAQCYLYDRTTDQCQYCLAEGRCVQGNQQDRSDFLCLCPRCHFGSICQHNTHVLTFTLESLLTNDLFSSSQTTRVVSFSIYIIVPVFLFIAGFINNLCCFFTFKRKKPSLIGVGHYLFTNSILSQLSLLCLVIKISHILISIKSLTFHPLFNLILCKMVSYFLSVFSRMCFWLTAFVAIERVYVTLYPKNSWLKQPKIAKRMILLIVILTFGSHVHEPIYYNNVNDPKYLEHGTWCVAQFTVFMAIYNQVNVVIHYSIPFLINFVCTIILIVLIARRRAIASKKKTRVQVIREQITAQKELFFPSLIIIICALPQFIISFNLACTELHDSWQRYILTGAYFLSYLPQVLTFALYIQPSTFYKSEFQLTPIGKLLKAQMQ